MDEELVCMSIAISHKQMSQLMEDLVIAWLLLLLYIINDKYKYNE